MRGFGTYAAVPFPYPVSYQSDGAGGLVPIPFLRIPTAVLQAAGVSVDGRAAAPGCGQKCACRGACGGCKRLHRRLRGLGQDGSIDPITGLPDIGPPPLSPPDVTDGSFPSGSGCAYDVNGNLVPGSPAVCAPSAPAGGGSFPSGQPSNWPGLINALSTVAGKIYGSTAGLTPQQIAANNARTMNPVMQSSLGAVFSASLLGVPIWAWGLGLGLVALARGRK
jgi:hypothetical protein